MLLRTTLATLASAALAVALAAPAAAGTFDPAGSSASLQFGIWPGISLDPASGASVTVSGGTVVEGAGAFTGSGTIGTSQFSGVPTFTNFSYTFSKPTSTATFASGFSVANPIGGGALTGFGGTGPLSGSLVMRDLGGALQIPVPLGVIGGPAGGQSSFTALGGAVTGSVTGAPWVAGDIQMTGLTTTLPNGQIVNTVTNTEGGLTRNGSAITIGQVSGGQSTNLTLVSPFRVNANVHGSQPGFAVQTFHFVPEPGTALLLGAGVAGLAALGRARLRG